MAKNWKRKVTWKNIRISCVTICIAVGVATLALSLITKTITETRISRQHVEFLNMTSYTDDGAPRKNFSVQKNRTSNFQDLPQLQKDSIHPFVQDEIFKCDESHPRTTVCIIKGNIRVKSQQHLVILYSVNPTTRENIKKVKPYPRKWDNEMMTRVNDVILLTIEGSHLKNEQKNSTFSEEDLREFHMEVIELQRLKIKSNKNLFNQSDSFSEEYSEIKKKFHQWSENSWRQKRAASLFPEETQLGMFDYESFTNRKALKKRGGKTEKGANFSWVVFDEEKVNSLDNLKKFPPTLACEISHKVPGVVFSTSGYTGNAFHDFTDGFVPLFATVAHFEGEVVFVVEGAVLWWFVKYEKLIRQLSNYPAVLLGKEDRIHCFNHLVIGLKFHDELTISPEMMPNKNHTIFEFQKKMEAAWDVSPYVSPQEIPENITQGPEPCLPLLSILSRKGSRSITNEKSLIKLGKSLGFRVQSLKIRHATPLPCIWGKLRGKLGMRKCKKWLSGMNENPTVGGLMLGVHGAALTSFLFLRENDHFLQIVPLGLARVSESCFGTPAKKMNLHYWEYPVSIEESTLGKDYAGNDSILVNSEGKIESSWKTWKSVYLDAQNVTLDLEKMKEMLQKIKLEIETDSYYKIRLQEKQALGECS